MTTYYLLHRNDFGLEDAPVGGLHPLRPVLQPVRLGAGEPARPSGTVQERRGVRQLSKTIAAGGR